MPDPLKIVIPMAGWGTRMRPLTWSKPKPLVAVAGRTALDYLLGMFATVPNPQRVEYVFILGPYLGELQIPKYVAEHYPQITAHYVTQAEMRGQSHALYLARKYLSGPMISCFSDTFIETDFSFLEKERADGVVWVKAVPDPRRFGVAELNPEGWITRLIEKPQSVDNDLALVGCYYFRRGDDLMSAIEEQMQRNVQLKNEFFLADAVNILLERKALFHSQLVETWLDTGTIQSTLETNRYLLAKGAQPQGGTPAKPGVNLHPPVYIDPSADVEDSDIGPNVSLGAGCRVSGSRIEDSILDEGCTVRDASLKGSMIGARATVIGAGREQILTLNVGDDSGVRLEAAADGGQPPVAPRS
ncbi:MAG TPA: sugar phosphate nucleotidyltransferase [Anaerolineales bacterium]|nr:sugar phosphate nucleotidyltransferase [Anaerolineales bacterium]